MEEAGGLAPLPRPADPFMDRGMNQIHAVSPMATHIPMISAAPLMLRGFEAAELIQASAWRLLSTSMSGGKSLIAR